MRPILFVQPLPVDVANRISVDWVQADGVRSLWP